MTIITTPQDKASNLARVVNLPEIYLKREDLHPYGSHKGRSIPPMIEHYYSLGEREFVISSSGNAALAASLKILELPETNLTIFVGNHISPKKLKRLRDLENDRVRILIKERPVQALTQAVEAGARSLRQSTDDLALVGYQGLAKELAEIPDLSAIFIGTSSGTTAQALAEYFLKEKLPIQVHVIQTSSCHPISDGFENYDGDEEVSIADAIVDRTAKRKNVLVPLIQETGGNGWFASNEDISAAQELVSKHADLEISPNSALSIVGAMLAAYRGWPINGPVACIICGE